MEQPSQELTEAWEVNLKLKAQLEAEKDRLHQSQKDFFHFRLQVKRQLEQILKTVTG